MKELGEKIKYLESQKTSFLGANSKSVKKKMVHENLMVWFDLRKQRLDLYDEF